MVPVVVIQSGCAVTLAVGAAGAAAGGYTTRFVAVDTQPVVVFFTVKLYEAGFRPLYVVEVP
jgi:hypothetical protein